MELFTYLVLMGGICLAIVYRFLPIFCRFFAESCRFFSAICSKKPCQEKHFFFGLPSQRQARRAFQPDHARFTVRLAGLTYLASRLRMAECRAFRPRAQCPRTCRGGGRLVAIELPNNELSTNIYD